MALSVRFENDMRAFILQNLPAHDAAARADMNAQATPDLLIRWVNWAMRFVPQASRRILASPEFLANPLTISPEYRPGVEALSEAVTVGADLTPFLSTRIETGYKISKSAPFDNRREDLDLLLNAWHIHHLHLSATITKRGDFVDRTKMLLLAAFLADAALFINIYPHGAWAKLEIAHILIDNWPNSPLVREIPGLAGVTHQSDDDQKLLRNHGIAAPFIERNGKTYMIGTGPITTAGTSFWATQHAHWLLESVRHWASHVEENPDYVTAILKLNGFAVPEMMDLEFIFMSDFRYGVRERNTRAIFPFSAEQS